MTWLPYAAATACMLAIADLCVKMASGKISNSLGMIIFGGCTLMFGIGMVLWQRIQGEAFVAQPLGILAAFGVGIAFSCVTLGIYVTFSAGAPVSMASPMIRVAGVLLASTVGLLFLSEAFTWRYAVGMVLAISGVFLIVTR